VTEPERIVSSLRVTASVLLIAPLAVVILAPLTRSVEIPERVVALACLAGLVTPVLALHRQRAAEERILKAEPIVERARLLRRITLAWLGVSGAIALAGGGVYVLCGDPRACSGPVLHLLVGAAAWPTAARVERLVERASA
jgi:hypothetical protein